MECKKVLVTPLSLFTPFGKEGNIRTSGSNKVFYSSPTRGSIYPIYSRKEADVQLSEFVPELGVRQFLLKNLYWKVPGSLDLRLNLEVLKANVEEVGEALELHYEVALPTLFLRGDRSEYIVNEDEKQISNQFSNFILVTIPNAGHWLHAENPEAFYSNVVAFLS